MRDPLRPYRHCANYVDAESGTGPFLCHLQLFFGRILYFFIIFQEFFLDVMIPKIYHV